jgi:hypothetical protein
MFEHTNPVRATTKAGPSDGLARHSPDEPPEKRRTRLRLALLNIRV